MNLRKIALKKVSAMRAAMNDDVVKRVLSAASYAADLTVVKKITRSFGVDVFPYGVVVTVQLKDLDGFRDRGLSILLEKLMYAGVDFRSTDDPACGSRDFHGGVAGKPIIVNIYAYLNDAPKNCRIVEVSRKRVVRETEEIERKFICN